MNQTILIVAMMLLAPGAYGQQEIRLRLDLPVGEEWYTPAADNPHRKSADEEWVRNVRSPVMEVYPAAQPNGTGVAVAPGGGFRILATQLSVPNRHSGDDKLLIRKRLFDFASFAHGETSRAESALDRPP